MINANELRIGNWMNPILGNTFEQVTSIKEHKAIDGTFSTIGVSNRETTLLPEHIMPIPLSPEILEMAGFTKHLDKGSPYYFRSGFRYNVKNGTISILRDCRAAGESQAHWCGTSLGDSIEMPYLHQLQNLTFALTGTELPLSIK